MDDLKQYLISVIIAAIVSGLILRFFQRNGAHTRLIKLLIGLFLSITVISPLTRIQFDRVITYFDEFEINAQKAVSDGTIQANQATETIIKDKATTYILDKASELGIEVEVDVTLTQTDPKTPCFVTIDGTVPAYKKQQLQKTIENDLGVSKENQRWK